MADEADREALEKAAEVIRRRFPYCRVTADLVEDLARQAGRKDG